MQTLAIKLDDGETFFHFRPDQTYPPYGYGGTISDYITYHVGMSAPERTAVEYGFIDTDVLDAWLDAGGSRLDIAIDAEHVVTLPALP